MQAKAVENAKFFLSNLSEASKKNRGVARQGLSPIMCNTVMYYPLVKRRFRKKHPSKKGSVCYNDVDLSETGEDSLWKYGICSLMTMIAYMLFG